MDYNGVEIKKIAHDCFMIKGSESKKVIYVDPYKVNGGDYEPGDIILITHMHSDHCSPPDIRMLSDLNTVIITVADCQSKLSGLEVKGVSLVEPGEKLTIQGLKIEAHAAYNINKFRSPGIPYHPKENQWVGFVIEIDGVRIYHTGDTDVIPEMQQIQNIDVALLPVSGTYVMTAEEAAKAANIIKPKLAIPMHYGVIVGDMSDAEKFKELCDCPVQII